MVVTTADGGTQKTAVTMNEAGGQPQVVQLKSRHTAKHVIIAVTCAVIACAVIAGIVVGVKLFLESTRDIVKTKFNFKDDEGDTVEEDVEADITHNVIEYHAKEPGKQLWVISDLNRMIQVIKWQESKESVCYVTPLNITDEARPGDFETETMPQTEGTETSEQKYVASEDAIKEKSMLGPKGEQLCDGVNTYWMTESCDDSEDFTTESNGREKRRAKTKVKYCKKKRVFKKKKCFNGKRYKKRPRCLWKKHRMWVKFKC